MTKSSAVTIATVITVYNRRHCIARAIDSALIALPTQRVIVVDDASQDGSAEHVRGLYANASYNGQIKLIELRQNIGVTGAKNCGYEESNEDWVIFLDSDDAYLPDIGPAIEETLATSGASPIVFFRCQDQVGRFVGQRQGEDLQLDLSTYLKYTSFGEALTAVNKKLIGAAPPYLSDLRGYEGLGCCRLIRKFGPARLSAITARVYDTSGADRLSISAGLLRRLPLIARGHWILVREFGTLISSRNYLTLLIKASVYFLIGSLYRLACFRKW